MKDVHPPVDPELIGRFAQLERIIQAVYEDIWGDWYHGLPGATKAELVIVIGNSTLGSVGKYDRLYLFVGEWSLLDDIGLDDRDWPEWKRALMHEMIHEYAHKAVSDPSTAGEELLQKRSAKFDGPGHEAAFFAAIEEKAPYFKMTPEEFITTL